MDEKFAQEQELPEWIAHGPLELALTDGLKGRASVRM